MSGIDLYIHDGPGPNPPKCAILLEELGLPYNIKPLSFGTGSGTVKDPEYIKLCPNGRVPTIVDHNKGGKVVWESGAILFYLAQTYDKAGKFFGKTVDEQVETMEWLTFQLSGLGPAQGQANWFIHYYEGASGVKAQPETIQRYKSEVTRIWSVLEQRLSEQEAKGSQFLVRDSLSLADIAHYPWLRITNMAQLDLATSPKLEAYTKRMDALQSVQKAYKKCYPDA